MTFTENRDMFPGTGAISQSAEQTEIKNLKKQVEVLIDSVSEINTKVNGLSTELDTATLHADSASIITETVAHSDINNAEIEAETVTESEIQDATIEDATITDATIGTAEITTANVTNLDAGSADVDSFGATTATIASATVTDETVTNTTVTNATVQNAIVSDAELTNGATVRGSVYFPEEGDKIYGEYLDVEAGEVSALSLTRETPGDSTRLVGYDNSGRLIPIDASLNPSNVWKMVDGSDTLIEPKDNRIPVVDDIKISKLIDEEPTSNAVTVTINEDGSLSRNELADVAVSGAYNDLDDKLYAGDNITIDADNKISAENTTYTAGDNVTIDDDNVISATDTTYTAGNNISISDAHEISCDISTMNFRGSKPTSTDLPASGNIVGDVWNVVDIATNFCWDGSQWIAIGSSVDVSGLMNKDGSNANIPTNTGTLTTSNELLVKDSDGKIKGESIADIKDDFFPVDSALSTTSENPVQNKVVTNAISTIFVTESSSNITVVLPGISGEIPAGYTIKVYFNAASYGTGSSTVLKLNGYNVKVPRCGALVNMPPHKIGSDYKFLNVGTTLELIFNGTCWVILGNPEVITYTSDTVSYRIKADGFIEIQWTRTTSTTGLVTISLPIAFNSTNYFVHREVNTNSSSGVIYRWLYWEKVSNTQIKVYDNLTNIQEVDFISGY